MDAEWIESPDDPRLDAFRHVADPVRIRQEGRFVAEGRRVVEDLLRHGGYAVDALLLTRAAEAALTPLRATGTPPERLLVVDGPAVLRAVTGHRFHQGCVGLVRRPARRGLDDLPVLRAAGRRLLVGLEGVSDPDNVGTIFRSARAFGAAGILLDPTSAHPLYRKALRTSLGAGLRLPFAHPEPWPDCLETLAEAGYVPWALTPDPAARPLEAVPVPPRVLLLLGSEERGLAAQTLRRVGEHVRIPLEPSVDSVNVAAAAASALHRVHAAHRAHGGHPGPPVLGS